MTETIAESLMMLDAEGDTEHLRGFYKTCGSDLNRFAWSINELFPLSDRALVQLIKVFTRLENAMNVKGGMAGGFCGGSTTAVPGLLRELALQNPSLAREMTHWAFHTTKNPYVPFGTYNQCRDSARSVSDYLTLNTARFTANYDADAKRSQEAKERADKRAADHEGRLQVQRERKQRREEHIARVAQLTLRQRIEDLIAGQGPAPDYYPREWASLDDAKKLTKEQQIELIERLTNAKRGPWRALRKALTVHVDTST